MEIEMSMWRCSECNICPLPEDVIYFWGETKSDLQDTRCLACRGKGPMLAPYQRKVVVVLIEKFVDLQNHLVTEMILGPALRDTCRLRSYGSDLYLTDGDERVWLWKQFPGNRDAPMTWELFTEAHEGVDWGLFEPSEDGTKLIEMAEPEEEEPSAPTLDAAFGQVMEEMGE